MRSTLTVREEEERIRANLRLQARNGMRHLGAFGEWDQHQLARLDTPAVAALAVACTKVLAWVTGELRRRALDEDNAQEGAGQ